MSSYTEFVPQDHYASHPLKKMALTHLDMELTERCNLNCVHCYINLPENDNAALGQELSFYEIQHILTEAAKLGCFTVRFTGGEPLLRNDFLDIYLSARKLGMKVSLFTNGTLITPAHIDIFKKIPPLEPIEISVYGMTEHAYQAVTRTSDAWQKTNEGICLLQNAGIPFVLKTTYLPQNQADIGLFETWSREVSNGKTSGTVNYLLDLRCRRDQEQKNQRIEKLRILPENFVQITQKHHLSYIEEMKQFFSRFYFKADQKRFTCKGGRSFCVDAYGNLQYCMMLRHPETIVRLAETTFREAISGFFPELVKSTSVNPEYLNRCGKCFLKCFCEQCPAKSHMAHGDLDTPSEYFCGLSHRQAEYLGLLHKNEKAWTVKDPESRIQNFMASNV